MLITLICNERIFTLRLPEKIAGKYWIEDETKPNGRILAVEAIEARSAWVIKADKYLSFLDDNMRNLKELYLQEGRIYHIAFGKNPQKAVILAERFTEDRGVYKKIGIPSNTVIRVGKDPDNDIVFENPYVGSHHCVLSYQGGNWAVTDNNSRNGIFVNNYRSSGNTRLLPGDTLFILGLKLIVGKDFLAYNNPDGKVRIDGTRFPEIALPAICGEEQKEIEKATFYYRSPRFIREIEPVELQVDSPTPQERVEGTPVLLTMGSSLVMGMASMSVGIITVVNNLSNGGSTSAAVVSLITPVAMLLGMILFPLLIKRRDKRVKKEREEERRFKYSKYLDNLRQEIKRNIVLQQELLNTNNPPIIDICNNKDFWDSGLWSKTPRQKDFSFVRFGQGNEPVYGEIRFPDNRFSIDDDIMRDSLFAFQKEDHLLLNVPVGVTLSECRVLGIVGDEKGIRNILTNIVLQLFLLHSYDEIKTIFLYDKKDEEFFSFVRNAQHTWDNTGKKRFLAVNEDGIKDLSSELSKIISERREMPVDDNTQVLPHYVVVTVSMSLSNKCAFLADILQNPSLKGFSVICAYEEMRNLPKECEIIAEVHGNHGMVFSSASNRNERISFAQDMIPDDYAKDVVRKMAEKKLDLSHGRYVLPGMLTFLDMFGVGRVEHLNILQRWKNSNPVKTLQTPVGVGTDGETFYLDLHEKYHGPHGLVAGMTGSGKSEFIISFILSLAVNYSPEEVAFVLIDYKGGGLTGAFENERYKLPHLAGTITNLDGGTVMRSILSIKSELRKRQAIFNTARDIANEGTMDIYRYQKMYRDGLVHDPMPHLFIISDEFAELKTQQPEFMDQLISTSRIGRSLGVHLILATQKPSGVVNDQIWANSKFKVCLKVQDKADSNDMLKRPEAAELQETGRFYLQVGYNEFFALGQSGWTGAPYYDSESVQTKQSSEIEIIDDMGNVIDKVTKSAEKTAVSNGKQIVRVMEYIDKLAEEEKTRAHQLWLPEIPADIRIADIIAKYSYVTDTSQGLSAVIGEVDDPYNQNQFIMDINFTEEGNVLIYGATGSGKEMMISAMLYSLYSSYSPAALNAFILDFGAETLRMFEGAPQSGGFIVDGENEKIDNFIKMIEKQMAERKKILSEYGGNILKYNALAAEPLPYYLVVINNYSHFIESYEKYEDRMVAITRECPKYGIYFVVTATNTMAVRYRMQQNFKRIFMMRMNDKSDYISLLGPTNGVTPTGNKGSGIYKTDETYVFQSACIIGEDEDINTYVRRFCSDLAKQYEGMFAKQISVVPKFISGRTAAGELTDLSHVSLGISYKDYDWLRVDLKKDMILMIMSESGRNAALSGLGLAEEITGALPVRTILFDAMGYCKNFEYPQIERITENYEEQIVNLFNLCLERNNNYKENDGHPTVDMSPVTVMISGYEKLKTLLSNDGRDKLITILDKAADFWNIVFIVCDSYNAVTHFYLDLWVINKCQGEGLWVGNGIADQIRLEISDKTKALKEKVDSMTGYYVKAGKAQKIRLVMPEALEQSIHEE